MSTRKQLAMGCAVLLATIALTHLTSLRAEPRSPTTADPKIEQLLKERVEAARRCYQAAQALHSVDKMALEDLAPIVRNLRDAELAVAKSADERIAALETYAAYTKSRLDKAEAMKAARAQGGDEVTFGLATFDYQTAQIEVLKAKSER